MDQVSKRSPFPGEALVLRAYESDDNHHTVFQAGSGPELLKMSFIEGLEKIASGRGAEVDDDLEEGEVPEDEDPVDQDGEEGEVVS